MEDQPQPEIQSPIIESKSQLTDGEKEDVIYNLVRTVEKLKQEVTDIKNEKIIESLQLPQNIIDESGVLSPPPKRLTRGYSSRPILESEIKEAQEHSDTARGAAQYLGVNKKTYRKWAMRYGIYKINPWGRGSKKRYWHPDKGKYPINRILAGEFPNYPVHRLKEKLIRSGRKPSACENCGFSEHRITDNKMPLILNFKDSNSKNHKEENLQLFCYNCTFLCGKGYIRKGKNNVEFYFNDPDRLQDAERDIPARF